ncbi:MAG: cell envelope integrity protein CreD [Actinomycetota bacterium]
MQLETEPGWADRLRSSRMLRLMGIGVLALLLLIPIARIGSLVSERQERAAAAAEEVASKWGGRQVLVGPALVVPYDRSVEGAGAGDQPASVRPGHLVFLPRRLNVEGTLKSEVRSRGIFAVPVYRLDLRVDGDFGPLDPAALGADPALADWSRASLVVAISDVRAVQQQTEIDFAGARGSFLPGTAGMPGLESGIHAPVVVDPAAGEHSFSFPLQLNGSVALHLAPVAETTVVQLVSDSPHPSFQGNWLPTERTVGADGFEARWEVPFLGRNFPQSWTDQSAPGSAIAQSLLGTELVEPVDAYAMAKRSLKYAGLFILLTFALVWLIEILGQVRVHPIQYLLLGAALCLFYLLELSLAEHLGFAAAYGLASLAVVGMVAGYAWVIFHRLRRTATVAGAVAGLYGYLYILLSNEDYALLMGSIGLFAILGGIMFATRRVEWSRPVPAT